MSTRSRIAKQLADGSFVSIYCHYDGYPSHNGRILAEHYRGAKKVDRLIKLGDISSLGEEIGTKHDWNNKPQGQCNAYGRDRGEKGTKAIASATLKDLSELTSESCGDYLYVFSNGEWNVAETKIVLTPITAELLAKED